TIERAASPASPGPRRLTPRQLPVDLDSFTGRADTIEALDDAVGGHRPDRTATAVAVIHGPAGVGKTAVAVHWAHRVQDQFPDGQLYANLRGFDPYGSPVTTADAVRAFLDALDVPPDQIGR